MNSKSTKIRRRKAPSFVKAKYISWGCPKIWKWKYKTWGFLIFHFSGRGAPTFVFFFTKLGVFKYKSRGEKGALFLLTRLTTIPGRSLCSQSACFSVGKNLESCLDKFLKGLVQQVQQVMLLRTTSPRLSILNLRFHSEIWTETKISINLD